MTAMVMSMLTKPTSENESESDGDRRKKAKTEADGGRQAEADQHLG